MNIEFDSKEEEYFYLWIMELVARGIITGHQYQPKPFMLSDQVDMTIHKRLKTKIKEQKQKLLAPHQYQADFLLWWNIKAKDRIFIDHEDIINGSIKNYPFVANYSDKKRMYFSVVDVKGNFNQNDAWRRFSIDQKWVFQKTGIFVQKIIPVPTNAGSPATALFKTTFIPHRYQLTDKSGKKRKINFKHQLVDSFLGSIGM